MEPDHTMKCSPSDRTLPRLELNKNMYKGESIQLTVDSSYNSLTLLLYLNLAYRIFLFQGTRDQDFVIKL